MDDRPNPHGNQNGHRMVVENRDDMSFQQYLAAAHLTNLERDPSVRPGDPREFDEHSPYECLPVDNVAVPIDLHCARVDAGKPAA